MENLTKKRFKPIIIFLSISLALSSIYYFLIIYSGTLSSGWGQFTIGLMWCPGISALITMKILNRNISDLGWKWGKTRYQIWSYLTPLIYALIAYLVIWLLGWGGFYNKEIVVRLTNSFGFGEIDSGFIITFYFILFGIFGTILGMASALGEEIGWRGFLVPELYKIYGFTKTSLISGFIWGIWHLPILLFADYKSATPYWYAMSCFVVLTISMSFIYTWFRVKSGSLWTAVILHASHNLFIQRIFTPLTEDTGNTAYYIDEFGIVLPIVVIGFAAYYWTKRRELNSIGKVINI
ncbi:CPBP family intramembrane glutamic endopeptidase [Maribacter halichondriae]|uniref:CPBP family intramembrane glutamic endopeptidase n=1 Tax=Maribacter halichondriae TaxID=2980554 RepID=UPI002358FB66|nr:CPBP family intramembrane glutamic endopeptidase [Maribacter sp. Hal144]